MAQSSDTSIDAGLSGLAVRNGINENLAALFSSNSGASAPSPTVGGMLWLDTSVATPVLRVRNNANTAWETVLRSNDAAISGVSTAIGTALITAADAAAGRSVLGLNYTFTSGSYVFENGLKMFTGLVVNAAPASNTITFPTAFVSGFSISLTAEDATNHVVCTLGPVTGLTSVAFRHNGAGNRNVRYIAIGT